MLIQRLSIFLLTVLFALFLLPANASESAYLDNRSTPQSLVASYFNALNRNEFARAWAYWNNRIEGTNFEDFVEGFTSINDIGFKMGKPVSEGAAGSTFTQIPLVVEYRDEDDWRQTYRGCFLVRIATPNIQSPPFVGHHFERGYLVPVDVPFQDAAPGECAF